MQRSSDKKPGTAAGNGGVLHSYGSAHRRPASAMVSKTKVKNTLTKSNQK